MSICSRRRSDSKPRRAERSVEFSAVPLAGLTTALRRAPWKLLFVPFDKPQHELFVKSELPGINPLHLKKIAVAGIGTVGEVILRLQRIRLAENRDIHTANVIALTDRRENL